MVSSLVIRLIAIGIGASLLLSCSPQSIYRNNRFDGTDSSGVMLIDAKQRGYVYSVSPERSDEQSDRPGVTRKTSYGQLKVCAEQAPDVFTVLSTSLAAAGSTSVDKEKIEAAANFARALTETGASIHRTQTVNLLAQSMYRTCERWMSGAIDSNEMQEEARRDQHAMVAVLAIEQLTNLAIVSQTTAEFFGANAIASLDAVPADQLVSAKKNADSSAKARDTAKADYDSKLKNAKSAAGATAGCEDVEGDARQAECKNTKELAAKTATAAARDEDFYQELLRKSKESSSSVAASAPNVSSTQTSTQSVSSAAQAEALAKIADTVKEIAYMDIIESQKDANCSRNPALVGCSVPAHDLIASNETKAALAAGLGSTPPVLANSVANPGNAIQADVFIQAPIVYRSQEDRIHELTDEFKRISGKSMRFYEAEFVKRSTTNSVIRFYHESDREAAKVLSQAVANVIRPTPSCQLIDPDQLGLNVTRHLVEIWIGENAVVTNKKPTFNKVLEPGPGC